MGLLDRLRRKLSGGHATPDLPPIPRATGAARTVVRQHRAEARSRGVVRFLPLDGMADDGPILGVVRRGPMLLRPGDGPAEDVRTMAGTAELTAVTVGHLAHRDSLGGRGDLLAGGVRLASGGSGLLSEVVLSRAMHRDGGDIDLVQILLRQPALARTEAGRAPRSASPAVDDAEAVEPSPPVLVRRGGTPSVRTAEQAPRLIQGRSVVTHLLGDDGAVSSPGLTTIDRVRVAPGATVDLPLPHAHEVRLCVLHGTALVGEDLTAVAGPATAWLSPLGPRLMVATRLEDVDGADLLVLCSPPPTGGTGSAPPRRGALVAADDAAVSILAGQARAGTFGRLPPWDA